MGEYSHPGNVTVRIQVGRTVRRRILLLRRESRDFSLQALDAGGRRSTAVHDDL